MPSDISTRSLNIFDLPREIRDLIYHHFWRSNPMLPNSCTRFKSVWLYLCYEGRYGIDNTEESRKFPLGLSANKQLLRESLAQFLRQAEWFWGQDEVERTQAWSSKLLDTSGVKDVTLYVGSFLPPCTTCAGSQHLHGWWWYDDELSELAEAMAKDYEGGNGIRCLRIAGSTQSKSVEDEYQHATLLAHRHGSTARGARAERFELSLWHDDPNERRVYEVHGEGENAKVVLKIDGSSKAVGADASNVVS